MAGNIDGIASGLDTSAIVQAIMDSERWRVNLMEAQQAERTDQVTVYNAVSAMLLGLKSKASAMTLPSAFDKTSISISDDSYLAAMASGGEIAEGSYRVSIDQLARNHQLASQGFANSDTANIGTGVFKIKVGAGSEKSITIDSTNNTLEGLKLAINEANAGVSASIINDGTANNPYRLLLTASDTGQANKISITNSLTGGTTPDFTNSSFDAPETIDWSTSATSTVSLGPTASYSGSTNKTYTFTVKGTGAQTVGSGDLFIDWTDGTNSGTINVSQADTEVSLGSGDGAEGLSLRFSAGDLIAGDTFQVQTFSPVVQAARDAKVSMGSVAGGGSPVTITSSTNTIDNLIPGVTLSLKKLTDATTPDITITTEKDTGALKQLIQGFISQYNEAMKRIDEYLKYNPETEQAGTLQGDTTLISVQRMLRSLTSSVVDGLDSGIRMLADLGIRTSALGELSIVNTGAFNDAIEDKLSDVVKLFTNWGQSSESKITFLGASIKTMASGDEGYDVQITQVATQGYLRGSAISNPNLSGLVIGDSNDTLKLKIDGMVSEDIVLTNKTYSSFAELAAELQAKIDEDDKIGSHGVLVSYVDTGESGYIELTSGSYGSTSKVEFQAGTSDSALTILGLAQGTVQHGKDVAGTINGEEAEGVGQLLTGVSGNKTTEGLRLKVELEESDIGDGAEASIKIVKGVASQFDALLDSLTRSSEGLLARKASAIQKQIDYTSDRIEDEEDRLAIRKQALFKQYIAMEELISEFNAQGAYLENQLSQISSNWNFGKGKG